MPSLDGLVGAHEVGDVDRGELGFDDGVQTTSVDKLSDSVEEFVLGHHVAGVVQGAREHELPVPGDRPALQRRYVAGAVVDGDDAAEGATIWPYSATCPSE